MQKYAIFGVLFVMLLLSGCSSNSTSQSEPSADPADTVQPDVPVGTGLEPVDETASRVDESVSQFAAPDESPGDGGLSDPDESESEQSINNLFGSIGRVLFGGEDDQGKESSEAEEESVLSSVGRALSKGAVEAAQQGPPKSDVP